MRTTVRTAALLAVAFLALHLPFLPASLEDLDSINFALGLRHFDVAQHQPHPPGYPVFIFGASMVNAVVRSEVAALGLVSVVSGALAVVAVAALFTAWAPRRERGWVPLGGTLLASTAPLFWMTAARPLSDMAGLAAALGVQLLTTLAASPGALAVAALCAGAAAGIRSQVVWLTVPLLALAVLRRTSADRRRGIVICTVAYGAGVLLWGVPLVVLSGGPAAYARALATQGTEDFTGVAMLATNPSPRLLASALYSTFLAPWGSWPIGAVVVAAAAAGSVKAFRGNRAVLLWLIAAFGPYAVFDLLFQETVTTRYALPLVLPVAYLAACGLAALAGRAGVVAVAAIAAVSAVTTTQVLRAYASAPAPAFRLLDDMRAAAEGLSGQSAPALAMHRRQELDLRRPVVWLGDRAPRWSAHLPAPPKREWMELVKYWNGGGRAPIWFVADPPRSDLALVDRHALIKRGTYRWPFDATALIGGVRPNVMDWYQIERPGWYVGEGWALTPETAGVAREAGRGPGRETIEGKVRRQPGPAVLMIGGRNLSSGGADVPVTVTLDDRVVLHHAAAPGFFLRFVRLDAGALAGDGDHATLHVSAAAETVAIEQFDVQPAGGVVYGFGDGWQELEYNPATGRLWRWTSERAAIRVYSPRQPLMLRLSGEFETSARSAHIVVRSGERVISEHDVPRGFTLEVPIPADAVSAGDETQLSLETDQWYVPAETNWRPSQDRRHLGLRLFECEVSPAS